MIKLIEDTQNKRNIIDNIDSMVNTITYNDSEDYYEELFMNYGIVPTDYPDLYNAFMALDDEDLYVCYTKVTEDYIRFKLQEDNLLKQTKTILQDWNAIDFSICAGTRLWNKVSSVQANLINALEEIYRINLK